eukprot:347804-Prymnesium_polylepis.1
MLLPPGSSEQLFGLFRRLCKPAPFRRALAHDMRRGAPTGRAGGAAGRSAPDSLFRIEPRRLGDVAGVDSSPVVEEEEKHLVNETCLLLPSWSLSIDDLRSSVRDVRFELLPLSLPTKSIAFLFFAWPTLLCTLHAATMVIVVRAPSARLSDNRPARPRTSPGSGAQGGRRSGEPETCCAFLAKRNMVTHASGAT